MSSDMDLNASFGRGMNTITDVYVLPADPEELNRLTLQHRIWKLMHGGSGLYPQAVAERIEKILSGTNGRKPAVVDVGTGSGIWSALSFLSFGQLTRVTRVLEMAERFPNAQVIGLDISGNAPMSVPNNRQEVCLTHVAGPAQRIAASSKTKYIPQYVSQFDVIHIRSALSHVIESEKVLKDLASYLRPGGILLLLDAHCWKDGNMVLLQPAHGDSIAEPGRCWLTRWLHEVLSHLPLKNSPLLDGENFVPLDFLPMVQKTAVFSDVGVKDTFSPIGWSGRDIENGEIVGEMMRENTRMYIEASKPALFRAGIPKETVETWAANILAEIEAVKVYMQWKSIWGFKT